MFKRMFSSKQPENVTKSIRCTKAMWTAIEKLAAEVGESPNGFIVIVLDQFLQAQVTAGKLAVPEELEATKISAS